MLVQFCADNHLDGIDLDWEADENVANETPNSSDYGLLIDALHNAMPAGGLLSVAVNAILHQISLQTVSELDWVAVMDYDLQLGDHANYDLSTQYLNEWAAYGVSKDKLLMGVPFYGRDTIRWADTLIYGRIVNDTQPPSNLDEVYDPNDSTTWYYNGVDTITKKSKFVVDNGFGGVMIWELGEDHFDDAGNYDQWSLLPAINRVIVAADTTPPSISITSPTTGASYLTRSCTISLGGTASDNVGVVNVTWSNRQTGGSGTATGTTSWTANNINLATGANVITVTACDAAGHQSAATLTATFTPTATSPAGTVAGWGEFVLGYVHPGTRYQAIAAGGENSLALKADGTVVAWGDNDGGQCNVPANLAAVIAIAAGGYYSLALKSDGTVVAWGYDSEGEYTVPANLTGAIAIAAGGGHSLALKSDGTVVAWGNNYEGQCNVPASLAGVIAIAAGGGHSLALKSDGTVVAWGDNQIGESTVPANLTGVIAIAAEAEHNLALKSDGTVVAWGDNDGGQCNVPANLTGVIAIAAGYDHSLALKSDGTVVAWGNNYECQCNVPASLAGVIAIAAGLEQSLALKSDGTVVAWGDNSCGESTVPASLTGVVAVAGGGGPVLNSLALKPDGTVVAWGCNYDGEFTVLANLTSVIAIAEGFAHNLALKSDGTVVAWGDNRLGESTVPANLTGVIAIAAGYDHSLALKSDGTVVAWGNNYAGESTVPANLTGVIAIAAGSDFSLALKSDGTVVAWGDNSYGECTVPANLTGVIAIAAGGISLALKSDGTVVAWPNNGDGECTVPANLTGVIAIAVGGTTRGTFSLALKSDGTVVAWGANYLGQSTVPANLTGVIAIAAADAYSLAIIGAPNPNVTIYGRVVDSSGAPLPSATITASISQTTQATSQTASDGTYSLPSLPPGVYVLTASLAGYASSTRALALNIATPQQNFQLAPLPSSPAIVQTTRQPPASFSQPPTGPQGSIMEVFDGTEFVPVTAANQPSASCMTIVLTHGWTPPWLTGPLGAASWPASMAKQLRASGVTPGIANILAWDWTVVSSGALPPEENTPAQGTALGMALASALGPSYAQPIHFIGHSLGTMVNAAAANYLHGDRVASEPVSPNPWSPNQTEMTLFDQAELSMIAGDIPAFFDGYSASLGAPSELLSFEAATLQAWKPAMPVRSAWADNYISCVGFYLPNAFNIALQKTAGMDAATAHGYPILWYSGSIAAPTDTPLGFQQTYEYDLTAALPSGTFPSAAFQVGGAYHQDPNSSDPLAVVPLPYAEISQAIVPFLGTCAASVVQGIGQSGALVVQAVGNVTSDIEDAAQQAAQAASQGTEYLATAAANAGQSVVNLCDSAVLHLTLQTGPPSQSPQAIGLAHPNTPRPADTTAKNTPAMAWVPVLIPANALAMAFDFTVSGDPEQESLVCGIGESNLFSLQAQYIPTNSVSASRLVDVSAWSGQQVELFFGLMGGTSTNATLQVDNIRFYSLQAPSLAIQNTNGGFALSWPSSAAGYVLESTTSLSSPDWEPVTDVPVIAADCSMLTKSCPANATFFRLRSR